MLASSLILTLSVCLAFLGRLFIYFTKEAMAPAWLGHWGYVFLALATVLIIVTVIEFFKYIVCLCRLRRARRGNAPQHHRRRRR